MWDRGEIFNGEKFVSGGRAGEKLRGTARNTLFYRNEGLGPTAGLYGHGPRFFLGRSKGRMFRRVSNTKKAPGLLIHDEGGGVKQAGKKNSPIFFNLGGV